ncbi:helicase [Arcobacter sp. F155]|uniref:DEAD/DEAH box helicase n=1 Tax=Arcobacter sp. F155 TaxID=2044512 RepID=UPI00100A29F1|nr:DEAD/DEAH box helicase family protein [Arcobacter sp. F155]RXJ76985.1 helicase [Arcobacter sp. F155]
MQSIVLPELIIDVFKEVGNKNKIQHFLDKEISINFEAFENFRNYIIIACNGKKYCLTKTNEDFDNECEYIIKVNKKPTEQNLQTIRFQRWIKHPKLLEFSPDEILDSWKNNFYFKEEAPHDLGLREPQIGAIYSILGHLKSSNEIATIVMPTGTGKTETMISVLVANKCEKLLIAVPSDSLRTQLYNKFLTLGILKDSRFEVINENAINPKVGILKQGIETIEELEEFFDKSNVIVTTMDLINSYDNIFQNKIAELCSHFFIDEAHHAQATSWNRFRKKFENKSIVQFTATPFRNDNKRLEGKIIFNFTLKKAQEQGYFKKINFLPVREYDAMSADEKIANLAVETLRKSIDDGYNQILMARCKNKIKAEKVFEYYAQFKDLNPVLIHSDVSEKSLKLERIKSKEHKIIVCVDMLGEGFDLPELKIAAFHDIRKSLPITLQFAGRFTRTSYDEELGEASFIVNIADIDVGKELNELYAQDANWNLLLSSISNSEVTEKLDFEKLIEGFQNLDNSSIPFQNINIPMSTVAYKNNSQRQWTPEEFAKGINNYEDYDYKFYDINESEKLLVIVNAKKHLIEWGNVKEFYNLEWNIIVVFYDESNKVLHIHGSDKSGLYKSLAQEIIGDSLELISGIDVFKAFHNIKRVSLQNVGLKEYLGKHIRFRMSVGSDVEEALSIAERQKGEKAFVFGTGYEDGVKTSLGCSYKGRIWSYLKGDLNQFKKWCIEISKKLINPGIDGNQILKETLIPKLVNEFPLDIKPILIDWNESIYKHKETKFIFKVEGESYNLSNCDLRLNSIDRNNLIFELLLNDSVYSIKYTLFENTEGDTSFPDFKFENMSGHRIDIECSSVKTLSIEEFFIEYIPTIWFSDNSSITGNQYIKMDNEVIHYPKDKLIDDWDWNGVDLSKEAQGVSPKKTDSIQYKVLERLKSEDYDIIYDDDGSGEIADIVTIKRFDEKIKIDMYHLKYAQEGEVSSRIANFYEVCGQAQKSIHWKHKDEKEFFEHLLRRKTKKYSGNTCSRLEKGTEQDLEKLLLIVKNQIPVEFEIYIVQPGTNKTKITDDILTLLSVTEKYIMDMSKIKLNIVING